MSATLPRLRGGGPARVGPRSRRILELDPDRRVARVQPGVINDQLRDPAEEHGLTFAPDPATHDYCTIGGQIGNNSCGTERALLEAMGIEWGAEDWGCCGMAGSFGYESHKYDLSMKISERHLLPAVRSAPDALVIADGFSCRAQVKQGAGREAIHTAQAVALALNDPHRTREPLCRRAFTRSRETPSCRGQR